MVNKIIAILVVTLVTNCLWLTVRYTNAAVPVTDLQNTAEAAKTTIQTWTTAINTATQIANQVIMLTSMSPEALLAHYLGVENDLKAVLDVAHAAQGLMSATDQAQQTWDRAFNQVGTFFSGGTSAMNQINHQKDTITVLDQTYRDAMNVARTTGNIQSQVDRLNNMMKQPTNGMKDTMEKHTSITGSAAGIHLSSIELDSALLGVFSAFANKQNQDAAQSVAWAAEQAARCQDYLNKGDPMQNVYQGNGNIHLPDGWY